MKWLLMVPVLVYRLLISPLKPRCCRFSPTCSRYALDALHRHGAVFGLWLAARRILRCHPFTEPAFDPVPDEFPRRERPAADQRGPRQRQT